MSDAARNDALARWAEVANIGAGHAADALSIMTGRCVWMAPPRIERATEPLPAGWECGAFFSLEGPPSGSFGVLLPDRKTVASVFDMEDVVGDSVAMRSALSELGNILVSHAATAMADTVGGVSLPSPPEPSLERATDGLRAALARRPGRGPLRICSELFDEQGELRALLAFVPDVPFERGLPDDGAADDER